MLKKSFHEFSDRYSFISTEVDREKYRSYFRGLVRESFDFILRYLYLLPRLDFWIAKLYWVDGLTQSQIGDFVGLSQVGVSRRLKFVVVNLKFFLKMPTLDPLQVRRDFKVLFKESLFEFAYYFYWEFAKERVRLIIRTSHPGAASKLNQILRYLKLVVNKVDMLEGFKSEKHYLALVYLEYFEYLGKCGKINYLLRKNVKDRNILVRGDIFCGGKYDVEGIKG